MLAQSPDVYSVFVQAAGQVPALVVLVVLVIFTLKHMASSEARHDARDAKQDQRDAATRTFCETQTDTMREIATDCKEVIKDNSNAMRENSKALGQISGR